MTVLANFTFTHIWLLVKCPILTEIRLKGPEKVNLQKIKNFSGQTALKLSYMATIKYEVLKHNMRKDKTWNVVIRVTHKRVMKYIPTTVFVTRDELTSSFKIKNFQKREKCEDILRI